MDTTRKCACGKELPEGRACPRCRDCHQREVRQFAEQAGYDLAWEDGVAFFVTPLHGGARFLRVGS